MYELNKRGLSIAQICTEPFVILAKNQMRVFKIPDLPLVIIPHPLGGLNLEKVEERADAAMPKIAAIIAGKRP